MLFFHKCRQQSKYPQSAQQTLLRKARSLLLVLHEGNITMHVLLHMAYCSLLWSIHWQHIMSTLLSLVTWLLSKMHSPTCAYTRNTLYWFCECMHPADSEVYVFLKNWVLIYWVLDMKCPSSHTPPHQSTSHKKSVITHLRSHKWVASSRNHQTWNEPYPVLSNHCLLSRTCRTSKYCKSKNKHL